MAQTLDKKNSNSILLAILERMKRIETGLVETRHEIELLRMEFREANETQTESGNLVAPEDGRPFAPRLEEEGEEEEEEEGEPSTGIIRVNQSNDKLKLIKDPDHRGLRTIDLGWVWEDKRLTLVERYHTLFQLLNKVQHGENATPIKENDLVDLRKSLLKIARGVRNMIYVDFPGIRYFTELVTADQVYYQLLLEDKVSKTLQMDIFLCKDMWCARSLLRESFKSGNRGIKTLQDIAREKVKHRRSREKEMLKNKAKLISQPKRKSSKAAVKVEAEEDPELISLNRTLKTESNYLYRITL